MPSPFPGIDPYLEAPALWPAFQRSLIACLHDVVRAGLCSPYGVTALERRFALADPVPDQVAAGEQRESYLEVRRADGALTLLADAPGPANRCTAAGRAAYLATRAVAQQARAHIVEIDLVLAGQTCLAADLSALPERQYVVSVFRAGQPSRHELYGGSVRKRLPRFRLPLGPGERDLVVDLTEVFARAYDRGGFAGRIDYGREPPAALGEEDRGWVDELLVECGH